MFKITVVWLRYKIKEIYNELENFLSGMTRKTSILASNTFLPFIFMISHQEVIMISLAVLYAKEIAYSQMSLTD